MQSRSSPGRNQLSSTEDEKIYYFMKGLIIFSNNLKEYKNNSIVCDIMQR